MVIDWAYWYLDNLGNFLRYGLPIFFVIDCIALTWVVRRYRQTRR